MSDDQSGGSVDWETSGRQIFTKPRDKAEQQCQTELEEKDFTEQPC